MEQQTASTQEIAQRAAAASGEIRKVEASTLQAESTVDTIGRELALVDQIAEELSQTNARLSSASAKLAEVQRGLEQGIAGFRV